MAQGRPAGIDGVSPAGRGGGFLSGLRLLWQVRSGAARAAVVPQGQLKAELLKQPPGRIEAAAGIESLDQLACVEVIAELIGISEPESLLPRKCRVWL